MRSHLLSVAAVALLSVFVVVSTPCLAQHEESGQASNGIDPALLPPDSDPTQVLATPDAGTEAGATIEEDAKPEEIPQSEE